MILGVFNVFNNIDSFTPYKTDDFDLRQQPPLGNIPGLPGFPGFPGSGPGSGPSQGPRFSSSRLKHRSTTKYNP